MSDTRLATLLPKKGKWGMDTLDDVLRNLNVAETGGDFLECYDALAALIEGAKVLTLTDVRPSAAELQAALDFLGPTGDKTEAYVKVAAQAWIDLQRQWEDA